ncbi:MAG: long-chain fatty acid--CoA ligase, partial [Candidatus Sericytochromatia bacterium]|nr:long-chain fatty acid--CoA ligase [Candidatus Sericytochromatia bacterium]
ELIILSNGKNVAPQPIENQLKSSSYIEQAMVIGDNRKYCTCLIVPNFEKLQTYAAAAGIPTGKAELMVHAQIHALLKAEIDRTTKDFAQFERIKKFAILADEWTVDSDELTPTMKCKRKIILKNHQDKVDAMYSDAEVAAV